MVICKARKGDYGYGRMGVWEGKRERIEDREWRIASKGFFYPRSSILKMG
jgi:hypothetical protein